MRDLSVYLSGGLLPQSMNQNDIVGVIKLDPEQGEKSNSAILYPAARSMVVEGTLDFFATRQKP